MIFHLLVAAAFATEVADPASVTPPYRRRASSARSIAAPARLG